MSIKLSICIPTYNRADCLPTALESVLGQINERVEIVICDNGSKDHTPELVASYLKKYPQITYFRFPQNMGPDRCFLQCIEAAHGEYCWFLSDDDIFENHAIELVLAALDSNQDLTGISVNRKIYDYTLQWETSKKPIQDHLYSNKIYTDAKSCISDLFIYFGYMTGQVCKRSIWREVVQKTENIERFFNAYIILFVVVKMICMHPKWLFLHDAYVRYRSDNDSFEKELGSYNRFLLDVVGYEDLACELFGKSSDMYNCCLNQVCKKYIRDGMVHIRYNGNVKNFGWKALKVTLPRYWTIRNFWLKNLPLILMPRALFLLVRKGYQLFYKPYLMKKYSKKLSAN